MNSKNLSVIIPIYNEHTTLPLLISKVTESSLVKEILLVDDFSTDGSRELLKTFTDNRIRVLLQPVNKGKGAAIKRGLDQVTGEYVIVQDADLEYDPADYQKLMGALDSDHQIIFGSRFKNGRPQMISKSFYANKVLTFLTNLLFGSSLTDMASCYKLIPTHILKGLDIQSNRFEIELEITAKLLSQQSVIKEIPISFTGRNYGEGKKIGWRDGVKDLWLLFKYRFFGFN